MSETGKGNSIAVLILMIAFFVGAFVLGMLTNISVGQPEQSAETVSTNR